MTMDARDREVGEPLALLVPQYRLPVLFYPFSEAEMVRLPLVWNVGWNDSFFFIASCIL